MTEPAPLSCPNCGNGDEPTQSTLHTIDEQGRPHVIVFYNCAWCDFSTWDREAYEAVK